MTRRMKIGAGLGMAGFVLLLCAAGASDAGGPMLWGLLAAGIAVMGAGAGCLR